LVHARRNFRSGRCAENATPKAPPKLQRRFPAGYGAVRRPSDALFDRNARINGQSASSAGLSAGQEKRAIGRRYGTLSYAMSEGATRPGNDVAKAMDYIPQRWASSTRSSTWPHLPVEQCRPNERCAGELPSAGKSWLVAGSIAADGAAPTCKASSSRAKMKRYGSARLPRRVLAAWPSIRLPGLDELMALELGGPFGCHSPGRMTLPPSPTSSPSVCRSIAGRG